MYNEFSVSKSVPKKKCEEADLVPSDVKRGDLALTLFGTEIKPTCTLSGLLEMISMQNIDDIDTEDGDPLAIVTLKDVFLWQTSFLPILYFMNDCLYRIDMTAIAADEDENEEESIYDVNSFLFLQLKKEFATCYGEPDEINANGFFLRYEFADFSLSLFMERCGEQTVVQLGEANGKAI